MIDVYTNGSQIGVSLHGWGGFLLLTYFILEMVSLFVTKSFMAHKLIIWFRLRKGVKKMIPDWWGLDKVSFWTIERKPSGFEVYVKVSNKINKTWTNDYVIVNRFGKIKSQKLTKGIQFEDKGQENDIKQWNRNKVLDDILS